MALRALNPITEGDLSLTRGERIQTYLRPVVSPGCVRVGVINPRGVAVVTDRPDGDGRAHDDRSLEGRRIVPVAVCLFRSGLYHGGSRGDH